MDRRVVVQLLDYTKGIFLGDWGTSLRTHSPVLPDIESALPASIELV